VAMRCRRSLAVAVADLVVAELGVVAVVVALALVVVVAVPASARVTKRGARNPGGYLSPPPGVFAGVRRLA